MGLKEKLFGGKSRTPAEDICAECGKSEGEHTDWCPTQHRQVDPEEAWEQSMAPPVEDDGAPAAPAEKH